MLKGWVLVLVGVAGLVFMRMAYDVTREPAPSIRVRWRDDIPTWRQHLLEMKYRLDDPSHPQGLSYAYMLFDTSARNIRLMVKDPYVADTHDIDRERFEVPWATAQTSQ